MALREKHAWRRRLGLRGSLWYFEEPKERKPQSVFNQPAAWSAIVAAISAVLTAIFAFNNYLLTKQSYLQTHPPKLVAVQAMIDHGGDGWTYSVIVRNDGNTEALKVNGILIFSGSPTDDADTVHFERQMEIPAGGTGTLDAGPFDLGQKKDGDFVEVVLAYKDIASTANSDDLDLNSPQRKDMFCGTLKGSVVILSGCDAVYREYLNKPAPISTQGP